MSFSNFLLAIAPALLLSACARPMAKKSALIRFREGAKADEEFASWAPRDGRSIEGT